MRFSISENPTPEASSSYLRKYGILPFLPEERSHTFLFFSKGDRIRPIVLEDRDKAH